MKSIKFIDWIIEIESMMEKLQDAPDFSRMTLEDVKKTDKKNEIEVFNYLLEKRYSFFMDKELKNPPTLEVW